MREIHAVSLCPAVSHLRGEYCCTAALVGEGDGGGSGKAEMCKMAGRHDTVDVYAGIAAWALRVVEILEKGLTVDISDGAWIIPASFTPPTAATGTLLTRELAFGAPKRRTSRLRSHLNFSSVAVVGTTGWSRRAGRPWHMGLGSRRWRESWPR